MLSFASLVSTINPFTLTMSLLELLKTDVGGQEASKRILIIFAFYPHGSNKDLTSYDEFDANNAI